MSIAILATLTSVLLPSLSGARQAGRAAQCLSNLRQIGSVVHAYAIDFKSAAPPGASGFLANLNRWHGARTSPGQPFSADVGGSMTAYLGGASGPVRACAAFIPVLEDPALLTGSSAGFERACGGYGYNNTYLGVVRASQTVANGASGGALCKTWRLVSDRSGSLVSRFAAPASTIAFSDAAFADGSSPRGVIEYSFSEARFWPESHSLEARADPSMHFRHHARAGASGRAMVAWLDGHAGPEQRTFSWSSGLYEEPREDALTGWTGPADDNGLYDYD